MLRFHTQTAGVSLTAQQPDNNLIRTTVQALSAVLGGTQSLHVNSRDEALALPSEAAVQLSLRTQQILAHESGVADVVDPLGGSYYVESLTSRLEEAATRYIDRIDDMGGAVAALEHGYQAREIHESAYAHQREVESGERTIVGVNQYVADTPPISGLLRGGPGPGTLAGGGSPAPPQGAGRRRREAGPHPAGRGSLLRGEHGTRHPGVRGELLHPRRDMRRVPGSVWGAGGDGDVLGMEGRGLRFTRHAQIQATARRIPRDIVLETIRNPEQIVPGRQGRRVHQSRYFDTVESKEMLMRVVTEPEGLNVIVVSIYKTSRMSRYWSEGS